MAEPIDFPESNFVYRGDGVTCRDLHCYVDERNTYSKWKLSPEDIAFINENGYLFVGQLNYGRALQPQIVSCTSLFIAVPASDEVN